MTTKIFTDDEKKEIVKGLASWVGSRESYFESKGISDATFYVWRKSLGLKPVSRGRPALPVTEPNGNGHENVALEFNIVQEKEAKEWVFSARFGRFMAMKESLIEQLRNLRKNQAITFQAPKEKREIMALHHACYSAIRKAGLPFGMRYSKTKGLFIILRKKDEVKE